ncbi:hypothetical protein ARMSODRAFT_982665 [Armillaria solidipes]|uniref:Uncharacterized protein n=1 Tax=Armillaria solidipes TaxID=1076256 RepID=A0A2H3AMA3_9AGAR|nr:hypothetical protein ARMSODRAFT_982665 [Armillaria solidipes]
MEACNEFPSSLSGNATVLGMWELSGSYGFVDDDGGDEGEGTCLSGDRPLVGLLDALPIIPSPESSHPNHCCIWRFSKSKCWRWSSVVRAEGFILREGGGVWVVLEVLIVAVDVRKELRERASSWKEGGIGPSGVSGESAQALSAWDRIS